MSFPPSAKRLREARRLGAAPTRRALTRMLPGVAVLMALWAWGGPWMEAVLGAWQRLWMAWPRWAQARKHAMMHPSALGSGHVGSMDEDPLLLAWLAEDLGRWMAPALAGLAMGGLLLFVLAWLGGHRTAILPRERHGGLRRAPWARLARRPLPSWKRGGSWGLALVLWSATAWALGCAGWTTWYASWGPASWKPGQVRAEAAPSFGEMLTEGLAQTWPLWLGVMGCGALLACAVLALETWRVKAALRMTEQELRAEQRDDMPHPVMQRELRSQGRGALAEERSLP